MEMSEFDMGYDYCLFSMRKIIDESKDPISLSLRMMNFVRTSTERISDEGIRRKHNSPKTVRKH